MTSTMKNKQLLPKNKVLKSILSAVVILSIWEIIALVVSDSYFMPRVEETFAALVKIVASKSFFKVIFTAFYRVILGIALGILLGIAVATICHKSDLVNTLLSPVISIMKATPVACIIVLLWIRLNYTEIAVFVVVLMVLPIIWQNVYDGFNAIDRNLTEVADVFQFSRIKRIKFLIIPSITSYLLPAIVTAIGLAWKAEIAAEIMTNSNIGALIYDYKTVSYDSASIFAWTVIIVCFSIIFEKSARYLLRRASNELNG